MKLKTIVAGALLAVASVSAFAGDKTITAIADNKTHSFSAVIGDGILSNGFDLITFNGLAAGKYKISVTISGQELSFDPVASNLNGTLGGVSSLGDLEFFGVKYTGNAPFTLKLAGSVVGDGSDSNYAGTYRIAAVPEPETYGMLLGGLALVGMVARRKAKKAV